MLKLSNPRVARLQTASLSFKIITAQGRVAEFFMAGHFVYSSSVFVSYTIPDVGGGNPKRSGMNQVGETIFASSPSFSVFLKELMPWLRWLTK